MNSGPLPVPALDPADLRILAQLQRDASLSRNRLADAVGLKPKQLDVRLGRLRAQGWLERVVALISNDRVGLPLTVFAFVETNDPQFEQVIRSVPEAAEVYRLGGEYLVKLMVADRADYARIETALRTALPGATIRAREATDKVRFTTELPLDRIG